MSSYVERERADEIAGRTPYSTDGREVDPNIGALTGEAASIEVKRPKGAYPLDAKHLLPVRAQESDTYFGMPLLKQPVWKAYVPAYFYTGGVVGASAVLGAAAQIAGGRRLRPLVRRTRWIATGFSALGAGLLIADLGRPLRFLYMLRVFRPTSPMNLGTWIVAGTGGASAMAALLGPRSPVGNAMGLAAGALGMPMAGYTAVLVANTAVPVWNAACRSLPALFVASAMSAAASVLDFFEWSKSEKDAVQVFGVAGKLSELIAMRAVEMEVASGRGGQRVARPLQEGTSGALWRGAKFLTAASVGLTLVPGAQGKRLVAAALGTAGALALRFAVMRAGKASARDPRATTQSQARSPGHCGTCDHGSGET